jgi:hypothetical protein
MKINYKTLLFALLTSLLIASCASKRFTQTITIKDTIIVPAKIHLDTLVLFKDSIVTIHDTTGQMTITIQKFRDKYVKETRFILDGLNSRYLSDTHKKLMKMIDEEISKFE